MTAKLQFKRGQEEREIACAPLMTIGRTPPNDILVPHPKISRNHAMIRMLEQGEYYLVDVGSTNGTLLNGKRVVMPTPLKDLDVITLEDCTLTFRAAPPAVAQAPEHDEDVQVTVTMTSSGLQMEEITLLVCDIRNYTPISESMPPNELAALMAKWFKMATKAIEESHGTIDKFIGDAIMVRWSSGSCKSDPVSVTNALIAAKKLNDICMQVNAAFTRLPFPFRVGVGINTGLAVLRSIGGSGYREYTAIGDSVNMAFRFETESKKLGKDIVIGPESYKHLPKQLWECACQDVTVKGKSDPISVWAIRFDEIDAILAKAAESKNTEARIQ
jgi:adenylate cyclase